MSEHFETVENSKKGTVSGQTNVCPPSDKRRKLSKTHADYWPSRLRKRSYSDRSGVLTEVPDWQVRLKCQGKESWFNLGTANRAAAAKKAAEIYTHLQANGWDAIIAKFKEDPNAASGSGSTVGEYLARVKQSGKIKLRTFIFYQNCLRTILSEAFRLKGDESRFDYRTGGNQKWVARIDRIRLDRITSERIKSWQGQRTQKAGNSPVALQSAQRSANSLIRSARSLFAKRITKELKGAKLPVPLPFDGVELFENGSQKYVSKIDTQALIAAAKTELKKDDPESYKVFLLGLFAGMRRGEIDLLEWGMVDFQNNVIRIEKTEWLQPKTVDSEAEITIDPEVTSELREFKPLSKSRFVIDSTVTWGKDGHKKRFRVRKPRNDSARAYYRCDPMFDRLIEWLRSKGVRAHKPLHTMRKEIGAVIATKHGIYAASRFLRHSDITTTARHYSDHKGRIEVGLGKLLNTDIKAVEAQEAP